jgi:RNA polymerase sigma factor
MNINNRVLQSKNDGQAFEQLLNEYRPFIASCVNRTVGKYVDEHDDEMSIGIIAFSEAVKRFNPESGKFLSYAGQVIRSRLIDALRAKQRTLRTVSLDEAVSFEEQKSNMYSHVENSVGDPVKLEIEALSAVLRHYGFSFMDITKCSPKHEHTKRNCAKVVHCILDNTEVLQQLKRTKKLPASAIESLLTISPKMLNRYRNYIVCLVEILSGDYFYLAEYLKFIKEVTKG